MKRVTRLSLAMSAYHRSHSTKETDRRRYYLPSHLSRHIDYVLPGVMASSPMKKTKAKRMFSFRHSALVHRSDDAVPRLPPNDTSECGRFITPACWKALYQIPDATLNQAENILGVFETGDTYDQEDLDLVRRLSYFLCLSTTRWSSLLSYKRLESRLPF